MEELSLQEKIQRVRMRIDELKARAEAAPLPARASSSRAGKEKSPTSGMSKEEKEEFKEWQRKIKDGELEEEKQ